MESKFTTWTSYMYGYNDPMNGNDPTGLYAQRASAADQMFERNALGSMVYNMKAADPIGYSGMNYMEQRTLDLARAGDPYKKNIQGNLVKPLILKITIL